MGKTTPRCHCTLPLTMPPAHIRTWDTGRDPDPGPWVSNVVRWGDEPHLRRWVRRPGTDMWDQSAPRGAGPGVAGEGGSSLDKVASVRYCRMGRVR
jgi:hypothetical protein